MSRKTLQEFEAHQRAVYKAAYPGNELDAPPDMLTEKGGISGESRSKGTVSQGARVGSMFDTRPINARDFHYTVELTFPLPA